MKQAMTFEEKKAFVESHEIFSFIKENGIPSMVGRKHVSFDGKALKILGEVYNGPLYENFQDACHDANEIKKLEEANAKELQLIHELTLKLNELKECCEEHKIQIGKIKESI